MKDFPFLSICSVYSLRENEFFIVLLKIITSGSHLKWIKFRFDKFDSFSIKRGLDYVDCSACVNGGSRVSLGVECYGRRKSWGKFIFLCVTQRIVRMLDGVFQNLALDADGGSNPQAKKYVAGTGKRGNNG